MADEAIDTELVIVGAGAAGLMAAVTAAECGLRGLVLERKHLPGRKLLMCGNNRCNLSFSAGVAELVAAYGDPVAGFIRPSLEAFPPAQLRAWFAERGLETKVHKDGRIFPRSDRADDVLHCFTDRLRELSAPLVVNCPVSAVDRDGDGFEVATHCFSARCAHVLLTTGGVSYPKTGSVGDGQRFAKKLGHTVVPYRPGLVGFELSDQWLRGYDGAAFAGATVRLVHAGRVLGETSGEILLTRWGARGPAMVDASRIVARQCLSDYEFLVDLYPKSSESELQRQILASFRRRPGQGLRSALAGWLLPATLADDFITRVLGMKSDRVAVAADGELAQTIARRVKAWSLRPRRPRGLKEAMVTVGGVHLDEVDSATMQSRCCSGLWFAGEVLDLDGPTGGFNLQAAFATARLAVLALARQLKGDE